jgi:hypothetical protein
LARAACVTPTCLQLPIIAKPALSPTATPTSTHTVTPTATSTATSTATQIPTATPTFVPTVPPNVSAVVVRRSNVFVPSTDQNILYVIGEVVNQTAQTVGQVSIEAVLRNAADDVIGNLNTEARLAALAPGMVAPFQIVFLVSPATYARHELTVHWTATPITPMVLNVSQAVSFFDRFGNFYVGGSVTNQTGEMRDPVKLVVTLYDSLDKVIGIASGSTNPSILLPGEILPFEVGIGIWQGKPDAQNVTSYTVLAVDDE